MPVTTKFSNLWTPRIRLAAAVHRQAGVSRVVGMANVVSDFGSITAQQANGCTLGLKSALNFCQPGSIYHSNIKILDLSYNNVSRIDGGFFKPAEMSLTQLFLDHNSITVNQFLLTKIVCKIFVYYFVLRTPPVTFLATCRNCNG